MRPVQLTDLEEAVPADRDCGEPVCALLVDVPTQLPEDHQAQIQTQGLARVCRRLYRGDDGQLLSSRLGCAAANHRRD